MTKIHMMIGIPGSGKSTESKKIAEIDNAIYLSSDEIRKELFHDEAVQKDHHLVFSEMEKRTKDALLNNRDVIYDATNISRKKRKVFINQFSKKANIIGHVYLTPFEICVERDSKRERNVGYDVIKKMYKNFQMPVIGEGFSEIDYNLHKLKIGLKLEELVSVILNNPSYEKVFEMLRKMDEFNKVWELPQDSTYHSFSASRHIYYVYDSIHKNYKGDKRLEMLIAGLFHDVGKGFCKSFHNFKEEPTRYANFIGHENVSAYVLMNYLWSLGMDTYSINDAMQIVSLHMYSKNLTPKVEKRLLNWVGQEQYERLIEFNTYDNNAK